MAVREFSLSTSREDFVNITRQVAEAVRDSGVTDGVCTVFCPHTTAAITINENADPDVCHDILAALDSAVHLSSNYRQVAGNSAAHVKSSLVGASEMVIIENGNLILGTWQSIFFCEFDGPRTRKVIVKFITA